MGLAPSKVNPLSLPGDKSIVSWMSSGVNIRLPLHSFGFKISNSLSQNESMTLHQTL
jgi:hypothetical protein